MCSLTCSSSSLLGLNQLELVQMDQMGPLESKDFSNQAKPISEGEDFFKITFSPSVEYLVS